MKSIKDLLDKLKKEKRLLLISAVGILIILLILVSEFPEAETEKTDARQIAESKEVFDYAQDIEKRLTQMISSIDGAGKVKVMVTLESSEENIYAADRQVDSEDSSSDGESDSSSQRKDSYIVIKTDSGDETGLILKIIQPRIRGVAVVCEGAGSAQVRKNITDAVTAVLDIQLKNVSVTKGSF